MHQDMVGKGGIFHWGMLHTKIQTKACMLSLAKFHQSTNGLKVLQSFSSFIFLLLLLRLCAGQPVPFLLPIHLAIAKGQKSPYATLHTATIIHLPF